MSPLLLPIASAVAGAVGRNAIVLAILTFLSGIAIEIASFFLKWFSKKTAMQLTIVASVGGLTITVFLAIKTLILGISIVAPAEFAQGMSLIIPTNLPICLSSIVSANTIRWLWIWKVHFIEMYASGN
ncbi:DUF5455 family protein [Zhongshania sp.]|uniref:DUF5455 family protein n=1 Tax=Zhongshania sp. TaxID=1971902 RepID=UPI003458728D